MLDHLRAMGMGGGLRRVYGGYTRVRVKGDIFIINCKFSASGQGHDKKTHLSNSSCVMFTTGIGWNS